MKIPGRRLGKFAQEIVDMASSDKVDRIQRGAAFRNLYLTGSGEGVLQTYPKINQLMDDWTSYIYSPVEMRLAMEHYGAASIADIRKERAAATNLHSRIRRAEIDSQVSEAVKWAGIKGKTFIKLGWTEEGYSCQMVQPEYMGVLQPDLCKLDDQEAFYQSTYMTKWQFARLVERHPNRDELMRAAEKYAQVGGADQPGQANWLKTVILGGMNPYKPQGSQSVKNNRGIVNWMESPRPSYSPDVLADILRLDELWIWNDDYDDYTTIQILGDNLVTGSDRFSNIFSDDMWVSKKEKDKYNPLMGKHPYIEFCAEPLDGYFWGDSEVRILAAAQEQLNKNTDGINRLLRRQEKPSWSALGMQGNIQSKLSAMNKPGGTFADSSPNAKLDKHAPEIPQGLYERVHNAVEIMHDLSGMRAVLRGEGEAGVRSQGHADALTRNASPNFKDKAILIERSVEKVGGLALDIAKAKIVTPIICWLKPGEESIQAVEDNVIPMEAPAKGMKPIEFKFYDLDDDVKVAVDSHSASPIFKHEKMAEIFDLVKIGAITPEQAVERLHPSGEDEIITAIERREIAQQEQFAKLTPEDQAKILSHGGKKR